MVLLADSQAREDSAKIAVHALLKHTQEFIEKDITTQTLPQHLHKVMCSSSTMAIVSHSDRIEYCDPNTQTIVKYNPRTTDKGTAYIVGSDGSETKDCHTYMQGREKELMRDYNGGKVSFPAPPIIQPASCIDDRKQELQTQATVSSAVTNHSKSTDEDAALAQQSLQNTGILGLGLLAITKILQRTPVGAAIMLSVPPTIENEQGASNNFKDMLGNLKKQNYAAVDVDNKFKTPSSASTDNYIEKQGMSFA